MFTDNILEYYKIYQVMNKEIYHNRDSIAMPLQISLRTGLRIPHTKNKKNDEEWNLTPQEIASDPIRTTQRKPDPIPKKITVEDSQIGQIKDK